MSYSLKVVAHSEVGLVRPVNQDAAYVSPTLLLVADGMGGAAAGDVASAVAAHVAADMDRPTQGEAMLDHVETIMTTANHRLADYIERDPTLDGMGTTFCGAAFDGNQLGIGHIGDSRMYRLREGEVTQLTHDHSWVQALIDEGRLTEEQAAVHPHRSLILKVLNGSTEPEPDLMLHDVREGDRYLFCSDGLSGLMSDGRLARLLSEPNPSEALAKLVESANLGGGHDNITGIIADIVAQDPELDRARPALYGSALEHDVDLTPLQRTEVIAAVSSPVSPDEASLESARYAPREKRSLPTILMVTVVAVAVLAGAGWGVTRYVQSQYFIAEAGGQVAVYNGMPGSLAGYSLNTMLRLEDIQIENLPRYYQRAVGNTISVDSLEAANETVAQLQNLAERCVEVREERERQRANPTSSVSPSPSPSPSSTPPADTSPSPSAGNNYPTYLGPVTPTASDEADPEAC